jgi:hypothetical protein
MSMPRCALLLLALPLVGLAADDAGALRAGPSGATEAVFRQSVDGKNWADQQDFADAELELTKGALAQLVFRQSTLTDALAHGDARAARGLGTLEHLFGAMESFTPDFPLVTP